MEEREIFLAAIKITNVEARAEFLDAACGENTKLRERLRDLVAAHILEADFLPTRAIDQMIIPELGLTLDHDVALAAGSDGSIVSPDSHQATTLGVGVDNAGTLNFLQASANPNSLGRLGEYEILKIIGRGGFGIVLKAIDEKLNRIVAIKTMTPELAATSPARKRFLREARAFAAVRHPNVVHIYAVDEHPIPHLIMEYIPGPTIQQRIDEQGPLELVEVLSIGQQIASGLAAAHKTGLIHRDIKPANILLELDEELTCNDAGEVPARSTENGMQTRELGTGFPVDRVKITDFGLARAADDASVTQSGVIAGTPMYMSPEQALGTPVDHRADLFSLGSVLYTMASGRPPFRASTTMAVLKRVAEDTPRPIREIMPSVPEWLCSLISKLHAKRPEDRFSSADELAALLGSCLSQMEKGRTPSIPKYGFSRERLSSILYRYLPVIATTVLTIATILILVNGRDWHSKIPRQTENQQSNSVDVSKTVAETPVELGLLIEPGAIDDGQFSDVSFADDVLTLDATSRSRQIWINFLAVEGDEMTIQTRIRVLTPDHRGFAKLVFFSHRDSETFGQIGNLNGEYFATIKTYAGKKVREEKSVMIPALGGDTWLDVKFVVRDNDFSLYCDDQLVAQMGKENPYPGFVAICCQGWLCEMSHPSAIVHKSSQHEPTR